jgi:UDP-N-acetyl-D-mannosaminuronic acid dehydrogenase
MSPEVVVVGLGTAGLPLALVLAEAGWRVAGVDADQADGEAAVAELLAKQLGRGLTVSTTLPAKARAYVIAVATPVGEHGTPDLEALRAACHQVGAALDVGSRVVLRSTVPPGTTRRSASPPASWKLPRWSAPRPPSC